MHSSLPRLLAVCLLALPAVPALAAVDGPALYKTHCSKCHGEDGRADTWRGYLYFARDFSDPAWQDRQSDARILRKINLGPFMMPAFEDRLNDEERAALVRVVRDFRAR